MSADRRALAGVMLVPLALWLACWPFADMAVNDDFAFAFAVKRLLATGRLTFNGWSCPTLGPQALCAAAAAAVFGFSHDVMRWSVLPFSVACAALTYALHRRLAVDVRWSAFATLVLVASPIYTPWAASFMTDVPGLACWIATLHAVVSLRRARRARGVLVGAASLAIVGLLGGSVRQSTYVLAGTALLYELVARWTARDAGRWIVAATLAAFACVVGAILRWASLQPYYIAEGLPAWRRTPAGVVDLMLLGLGTSAYLLPFAAAVVPCLRVRRRVVVGCIVAGASVAIAASLSRAAHVVDFGGAPFIGGTISPTGVTTAGLDAPGERPVVLPAALRVALAGAAYAALLVVAIAGRPSLRGWDAARASWRRASPETRVFAVMAVVYVGLLFPRATIGWTFDRYGLVVMPIVTAIALSSLRPARGPNVLAWVALAAFAGFGAIATNDHFRELRARAAVAADLIAGGVRREEIADGLTFDAWTQLGDAGYINDFRLPPGDGGFRRDANDAARKAIFWFLPRTPVVTPRWIVEGTLARPSVGGDVVATRRFVGLLPPGERWLRVRHDPNAPAAAVDSVRP